MINSIDNMEIQNFVMGHRDWDGSQEQLAAFLDARTADEQEQPVENLSQEQEND